MGSRGFDIQPQVPQQRDDIISIDHQLYKAAAMGNISPFERHRDSLHRLMTRGENTVLHIHFKNRLLLAEKPKSTNFGLEILSKMFPARNNTEEDNGPDKESADFPEKILEMCPTLLTQQNHIGENPLHVAAKYGDVFAVKLLIGQCAKSSIGSSVDHHEDGESGFRGVSKQMLLRMKNNAGDTALHKSMGLKLNKYTDKWLKHLKVAKILSKEDIAVMYDRNAAGETPLYLAVKAGFYSVIKKGLDNMDAQTTSNYYGGSDGKTILHEAVISDFFEIDVILTKRQELCRVADDEKGWVPLHYAANLGKNFAVEKLLEYDPFAAGIKDKIGRIPLQVIADPKICRSFIRKIISKSPDCCEVLTIDEKIYHDDHAAATEFNKITKQDRRNIKNFGCDVMEFEEENKHAFKIWTKTFNDGKKSDEEKLLDKESTLVVAALIATVTFAAGFTLPGGYVSGGDNLPSNGGSQPGAAGSAVLSENAAFKAFLISDAIAMALSSCAVFIHLFLALKKDRTKDRSYFLLAFKLIIVAMVVMVVAFMTGIYAVLGSSNAFAIASCVFISVSFLLCIVDLTFGYFTDYVYSFLRICALRVQSFLITCVLFVEAFLLACLKCRREFMVVSTQVMMASTVGSVPFIFASVILLLILLLPILLLLIIFLPILLPIFLISLVSWMAKRRRGQLDQDSQSENSTENRGRECRDSPPKSDKSIVDSETSSINEESAELSEMPSNSKVEKGIDAV
nr:ankyrin repeat-containing protein At5g02620-like isoform X2 [Ziziphus jujuba var. spinosa]